MDKQEKVVGLRYRAEDGVPQIVLKGLGPTASNVLKEVDSLERPPLVVRDDKLLEQLFRLPTDSAITPELYELVAAIMVHVFEVNDGLLERKEQA